MSVRQNQSHVWQYYSLLTDITAKCIKCNKILACKGWSTSGLSRHRQTKYEIFENKCESKKSKNNLICFQCLLKK